MHRARLDQELAWIRYHMPATRRVLETLPDLRGMRLACSMHLDAKMVLLMEGLLQRGVELFVISCNPATVRDEVAFEMARLGARVEAQAGMSEKAYHAAIDHALAWGPTHVCEMGADLTHALHAGRKGHGVRAGLEATGSGIARLAGLSLTYPVFNWDDLPVKEGLHNRHMVGLTTWHAFMAQTRLSLHEKRVLVVGYGSVGWGLAAAARAFGGVVMVADKDPVRRRQAAFDGWLVKPLDEAVSMADVIVTATGAAGVITGDHVAALRSGAFLLNCGHCSDEIDLACLRAYPSERVLPFVERFQVGAGHIFLFAGGAMANLVAGPGDSINAFDITLSVMAAAIGYIAGEGATHPPGVHLLPTPVWSGVL